MTIETRSIEELKARYELEPELDDVYVEGFFDKEVLTSHLAGSNSKSRTIYEIETVDIPNKLLTALGLTTGNKQRVIALATELEEIANECAYRCLVDTDLDFWLEEVRNIKRLNWTTFCTLELHLLTEEVLREILFTASNAKINDFEAYCKSLCSVLCDLYALRLSDKQLELNLKWLPYDKYLSIKDGIISFDLTRYASNTLRTNGHGKIEKEFMATSTNWMQKFGDDCRHHSRGHDFVHLIAWSVNNFKGIKEFSSNIAIERLLILLARNVPGISNDLN
ncbi:DUF4435 domain-containing protein [Variovorax sp. SG517]|uniref:DUF4435 domain-containing protein n=1 Tax=Variovorax sp. SG517 TaxID=2587117 RepID=UPI00159EB707|nr:DUF4435 domain-containing protein [Variovorax sp. SG517]